MTCRLRTAAFASACLVLLWGAAAAEAQLPQPLLNSIEPAGAKQGTEFELEIKGNDLDQVEKLLFSHPGITAKPKMLPADDFHKAERVEPNKFLVKIAGNVEPGYYEVVASGRFGVSNPRAFSVGTYPDVAEEENDTLEKAQLLTLGSTVNGRTEKSKVDYYKLHLTKGQRVLFDCAAQRLDSRMDATLVLLNAQGREIARARDYDLRDPLLDFTAPEEADYTLGVYDYIYEGGDGYHYRLTVHNGPHVDFVYPPVGLPGETVKAKVYGRNLPGGKPCEYTLDGAQLQVMETNISLPGDPQAAQALPVERFVPLARASCSGFPWQLAGTQRPYLIGFGSASVVLEQDQNNEPAQAQSVAVPCEVVGQFYPDRDQDWYTFEAKAGEVYWIDVVAHRRGLNADPYLLVQRVTKNEAGEENVQMVSEQDDPSDRQNNIGNAFDVTTDDPSFRLEVKEDATYRVLIRDQYNSSRNDPRYVYRMAIRRETPDFRLLALPALVVTNNNQNQPSPGTLVIRRGGAVVVDVRLLAQDGFNEEVTLSVEGLPGGLSCRGAVVSGSASNCSLVIESDPNAGAWSGPIRIVGRAKVGNQDLVRTARVGNTLWSVNIQQERPQSRLMQELNLAVLDTERAAATLTAGEDKVWETCRGGKLEIPVKSQRHDGFDGEIKLKAVGLPAQIKPNEVNLAKGNDGKLEVSITDQNTPPGTYTFYLQADTKLKYARFPESLEPLKQRQKELEDLVKQFEEEAKNAEGDAAKPIQEKLNQAKKLKQDADKAVTDTEKNVQPKDVNIALFSQPIKIRVAPHPLKLTAGAVTVKQGETAMLDVNLERLYGFDDSVDITFAAPQGTSGIGGKNFKIEKGQGSGKLEITANASATPGEHTAVIKATCRYNNVQGNLDIEFPLKVEEVKKEE